MGGSDCEAFRDGWLAQPANAVSSLAFLAAGAYVLARARHAERPERPALVAGAVALAMVSFGSLAFHGPQPAWADFAHDGSIAVLLVVYLAHGLGAGVTGIRRGRQATAYRSRAVAVTLVALAAGAALFVLGRTGAALCAPHSLAQAHAGWHICAAVAAAAAFAASTPRRQPQQRSTIMPADGRRGCAGPGPRSTRGARRRPSW